MRLKRYCTAKVTGGRPRQELAVEVKAKGRLVFSRGAPKVGQMRRNYFGTGLFQKREFPLRRGVEAHILTVAWVRSLTVSFIITAQTAALQTREHKSELEMKIFELNHKRQHTRLLTKSPQAPKNPSAPT